MRLQQIAERLDKVAVAVAGQFCQNPVAFFVQFNLAMHHAASIALPAPTLFTAIFQNLVWRIFLSARHLRPHLRPPELKVNRTHAMMSNGPRRFETNIFYRLAG